jgi:hypothetical protein
MILDFERAKPVVNHLPNDVVTHKRAKLRPLGDGQSLMNSELECGDK